MKKVRKCKNCGQEFISVRTTNVFCSVACREEYNARLKREEKETNPKVCIICGAEFIPLNSNVKCCSKECREERRKRVNLQGYYNRKEGIVRRKKKVNKVSLEEKLKNIHDSGMTYAEYQIVQTMSMIAKG